MSYTLPSTCIKHNSMPIQIYNQCVACEVQMYKDEADKYKKALEDIAEQFTPRNAFTCKHDRLVDIAREALK